MREPMHPADEFEAFRTPVDSGLSEADVAARFGVTEVVVSRRLRLAHVSSIEMASYRRDELSLEQVTAFAVSDDHAAQERVFLALPEWNSDPDTIRGILSEGEIAVTNRQVQFVTLAVYEQAGRDLFTEGDEGLLFILDPILLDRVVSEKLESRSGCGARPGLETGRGAAFVRVRRVVVLGRRHEEPVPLSPEQEAEFNLLVWEQEKFADIADLDERQQARFDAIEKRLEAPDSGESRPRRCCHLSPS